MILNEFHFGSVLANMNIFLITPKILVLVLSQLLVEVLVHVYCLLTKEVGSQQLTTNTLSDVSDK